MDSTGTPGASCRLGWRTQPHTRQWRSPQTVLAWMDDAEELALVVHNTCPFCRAEPGDLCHDLAGMATYSPHPERCGDGAIPLRGPRRARR